MKITTIITRTLIGLLMLFASISYFFALIKEPAQVGNMKIFNDGLKAAVYLMPLVKSIELLCGICFVSGKFMKIAPIVLFPIVINIFCISLFLANEVLPIGVFLLVGNLFLIYSNWASYRPLFKA
jgi:putative oxidoreductase